jgi:hypothetical protein
MKICGKLLIKTTFVSHIVFYEFVEEKKMIYCLIPKKENFDGKVCRVYFTIPGNGDVKDTCARK